MQGEPAKELLQWMNIVRRDLGTLLVHWTRRRSNEETTTPTPAFGILKQILRECHLCGSSNCIKGKNNCVCFTETPLSEMVALFKTLEALEDQRYEPFGIAVTKEWLFRQGGRPVIYQSDSECDHLEDSMKWRHSRYEPGETDFTWEREWRIKTNSLKIEPSSTIVLVQNESYAEKLLELDKSYTMESHSTGFSWIIGLKNTSRTTMTLLTAFDARAIRFATTTSCRGRAGGLIF